MKLASPAPACPQVHQSILPPLNQALIKCPVPLLVKYQSPLAEACIKLTANGWLKKSAALPQ